MEAQPGRTEAAADIANVTNRQIHGILGYVSFGLFTKNKQTRYGGLMMATHSLLLLP